MHIIWQPTFACEQACPGCYLTDSDLAIPLEPEYLGNLAWRLTHDKEMRLPEQLTVSVDAGPDDTALFAFKRLGEELAKMKEPPSLYVTFRDELSYVAWMMEIARVAPDALLFIKAVTFSTIVDLADTREVLENYTDETRPWAMGFNLLAGEETPELLKLLPLFDYVYLLLRKPQLGGVCRVEDVQQWFTTREKLNHLAIDYVQDKCVESCYSVVTGQQEGCHGGIQIKTVWPGGEETGCPYNSNGVDEGDNPCRSCGILPALHEHLSDSNADH
tara:strand:+ start:4714 stop:5535 length:822 start_codon:yes stop_codon:yes gene_type:complete